MSRAIAASGEVGGERISPMDKFVRLQRRIAPEIVSLLDIRYSILRHVHFYQPIGRRTLSAQLAVKERTVRGELEFLRRQGFVSVTSSGATLTSDGEVIFQELGQYVRELRDFAELEQSLERLFPIRQIVVVAGDSNCDPAVKKDMGRAVIRILREIVQEGDIIAAGGGTTMVEVTKAIVPSGWPKNITVVPTRGSLGEEVEIQADSVAVEMARLLGGMYRVLNVPDDLHPETISRIVNEPRIKEILELIKAARIVIHGVGTLEEMVKRRNIPPEEVETLKSLGAVAEMFGYYFDKAGNMVYYTPSMGIRPEDLRGRRLLQLQVGQIKLRHYLQWQSTTQERLSS